MAFITKNTFLKIISNIDLRHEPAPSKARLENKDLSLLSKREKQRLALITEILGHQIIPEDRFFMKISPPADSYTYIHPEKNPSYHLSKTCKSLNTEYENYIVPIPIREQGQESVKRFRKFFFESQVLFQSNRDYFFIKVRTEFNLKKVLTDDDFIQVSAPNSGTGEIEGSSLAEIEESLDYLIKKAESFKHESPKNRLAIAKYGNLFNPEIDDREDKKIIEKWQELKKEIKKKYIIFSMIKNNSDIDINENFLDGIGLKKCSLCFQKNNDFDFIKLLEER